MLLSEILFLIATICALAALAVGAFMPSGKPPKSERLPSFTRGHDVEDAEIIQDRLDVRR